MVKEALRPLFEKEGLTLIPPAAGAQLVVNLAQDDSDGPVEIVVLAEHQTVEGSGVWGVGCGERRPLTPEAFLSLEGSGVSGVGSGERRPLTPEAFLTPLPTVHSPHLGTKLETVLRHSVDIESLPILNSHIIDGHPVLPMAIILEWLAEGAIQRNPGLVVSGLDNLVLYKGVILSDLEAVRVEIKAGKAVRSGREFTVLVELWGTLANGREVTHARAEVILADRHATGSRKLLDGALSAYPLTRDEIYQTVLFHGAAMQGIERVEGLARRAVAGWVSTAPSPS